MYLSKKSIINERLKLILPVIVWGISIHLDAYLSSKSNNLIWGVSKYPDVGPSNRSHTFEHIYPSPEYDQTKGVKNDLFKLLKWIEFYNSLQWPSSKIATQDSQDTLQWTPNKLTPHSKMANSIGKLLALEAKELA